MGWVGLGWVGLGMGRQFLFLVRLVGSYGSEMADLRKTGDACIRETLYCQAMLVNLSIMMSSENRTITYAGFEYLRILGNS